MSVAPTWVTTAGSGLGRAEDFPLPRASEQQRHDPSCLFSHTFCIPRCLSSTGWVEGGLILPTLHGGICVILLVSERCWFEPQAEVVPEPTSPSSWVSALTSNLLCSMWAAPRLLPPSLAVFFFPHQGGMAKAAVFWLEIFSDEVLYRR